VTKAPKIKKELAHVNFEAMEAIDIEALFRAIGHQVYKNVVCRDNQHRIKLLTGLQLLESFVDNICNSAREYQRQKSKDQSPATQFIPPRRIGS
jgi:methionyl-tRNA formyltransferase